MTPAAMRTCCRLSKILSLAAVLALVVALCVTLDLSNWNHGMETPSAGR